MWVEPKWTRIKSDKYAPVRYEPVGQTDLFGATNGYLSPRVVSKKKLNIQININEDLAEESLADSPSRLPSEQDSPLRPLQLPDIFAKRHQSLQGMYPEHTTRGAHVMQVR